MKKRYRIQFPKQGSFDLGQDEVSFKLIESDRRIDLRFHDYAEIYGRPGLYEQLFYERLQCSSPQKVGEILAQTLRANGQSTRELRVLDLGAGNGMMGEVLRAQGVSRLVGADIIQAACDAALRDRPDVYDEYYVADFTALDAGLVEDIGAWGIDCLTVVAALGFGDIPPAAFLQAMQFVREGGWIAFNIRDTFLDASDDSGFSRFVREMIAGRFLSVHHLERYRHRLSMEGAPLFYYALVARKNEDVPTDFLASRSIVA
ncbi:MAG: methyltransferase [Burkholderiaceae bacterium]|nr:methyltransferase [Burkholderiaceae bacterium]